MRFLIKPLQAIRRRFIVPFNGRDRWGWLRVEGTGLVVGDRRRVGRPGVAGLAIGAAALAISACSSSEEDSSSTQSTTSVESVATTSSTETTIGTTSTTAPAETTTTTEVDNVEPEVRAALTQGFRDYSDCLVAMPSCDPTTLAATRAGELLQSNVARINEWNGLGYTVRDREQFRFVIESVQVDDDGSRATATVCIADGSKLVLPAADGTDVIIDDTFVSGREAWDVRLDPDGTWRAYAAPGVGETSETDQCPA